VQPFYFFTDHAAPLGEMVHAGRWLGFRPYRDCARARRLGQPPHPQSADAFEQSRLDWAESRTPSGCATLQVYQSLLQVRREWQPWVNPSQTIFHTWPRTRSLAIIRNTPQARACAVLHWGQRWRLDVSKLLGPAGGQVLLDPEGVTGKAFYRLKARPCAVRLEFKQPALLLLKQDY
jgi:hypothetical protein